MHRLDLYLAVPILQKHLEFLVDRFDHLAQLESKPDGLEELFSPEWMHETMTKVVSLGIGHITQVSQFLCFSNINHNEPNELSS